jgi:hypothetical protein
MRAITPFFVIILVMLLIWLPFVIKWFFTGSTYGVYYRAWAHACSALAIRLTSRLQCACQSQLRLGLV